jgi:hypothetical protein
MLLLQPFVRAGCVHAQRRPNSTNLRHLCRVALLCPAHNVTSNRLPSRRSGSGVLSCCNIADFQI